MTHQGSRWSSLYSVFSVLEIPKALLRADAYLVHEAVINTITVTVVILLHKFL